MSDYTGPVFDPDGVYVGPADEADDPRSNLAPLAVTSVQNMVVSGLRRIAPGSAPKMTEFDEGTHAVRLSAVVDGVVVEILIAPRV